MEILKIDGSHGEGGGQILRSALTLSCITKQPIQIENIRYNRKIPGLRPSNLSTINLLAEICDATVEGNYVGSTGVKFFPNEIQNAILHESVGTAGSISLILQAVIPSVSLAGKKVQLTISGGTDVLWSPTINYTKYVLSEAYSRIGIKFSIDVKKRGYYPKGGGLVDLMVLPYKEITPIYLSKRTAKNAKMICSFSKIGTEIHGFMDEAKTTLNKNGFSVDTQTNEEKALDRGASLLIFNHDVTSVTGADGLFDIKSITAEKISTQFINSLGVDSNLADMLVIPLSLTKETSTFTVKEITKHLETNLYITSKITGCKYGVGKINGGFEIRIQGS